MQLAFLVGLCMGAAIALLAHALKFDRDRSFYPTVLIVIASYYVLFAFVTQRSIGIEIVLFTLFVMVAVAGYLFRAWIVGLGLVLHGLFDAWHWFWPASTGIPHWWPGFCLGADIVFGAVALWIAYSHQTFRWSSSISPPTATANKQRETNP